MIKIFSGLGTFSHPFDVEGHASSATVDNSPFFGTTDVTVVVDHAARSPLGTMNNPSALVGALSNVPSSFQPNRPALPAPVFTTTLGEAVHGGVKYPPILSTVPQVDPEVLSQESGPATYDTLFHDFDIQCFPVYNFWVADEETNDTEDVGDRQLDDIPRYIRVNWVPAPDLSMQYRVRGGQAKRRRVNPVIFGSEIDRSQAVVSKGITFVPDHLNNFSLVKQSLANGFVSPGTVHSVVELQHNATTNSDPIVSTDDHDYIDEDTFLQHPDFDGISLEELRSNVHSLTNGVTYAGRLAAELVSPDTSPDQANMFSGKFSIEKPPESGGIIHMNGIAADSGSPVLSVHAAVAEAGEQNSVPIEPLLDMVEKVIAPPPIIPDDTANRVRVNFVYPSLGGLLDSAKVMAMQAAHHAESTTALAQFLPNLEVMNAAGMQNKTRPIQVPNFPSPSNLPPIEYIGYVLEKYEQTSNGAFILKETIDLPSREYTSYIDSKIKYSTVYRYRVRAIVRWTRPNFMGILGSEPTVGIGAISQTRSFSPYNSSYFHSEWSKDWAYGMTIDAVAPSPPDELRVRPDSSRKQVVVSFKLPTNQQRDIYYMRLFRKLQDENGIDVTGWTRVGSDWGPENVLFFDRDVDFFQDNHVRYVYAAQTVTRHNEFSPLSEQLGTRLNRDFVTYGEYPISFVSQAGVKLEYHGAFGVYPFHRADTELVIPMQTPFVFSGRVAHGNIALDGNMYFVRIESLDTGEVHDYPISIVYNNLPTRIDRKNLTVSVPTKTGGTTPPTTPPPTFPTPVFRDWTPMNGQPPLPRGTVSTKPVASRNTFGPGGLR